MLKGLNVDKAAFASSLVESVREEAEAAERDAAKEQHLEVSSDRPMNRAQRRAYFNKQLPRARRMSVRKAKTRR